jgi:tetratricopeptide (TPR) repeat protein
VRAARFGYPRENLYKLWERKGKCYQGLKRYDLAAKCYRQAMQGLKESSLR